MNDMDWYRILFLALLARPTYGSPTREGRETPSHGGHGGHRYDDARDACPGYKAVNAQLNGSSVEIDLELAGKACNVFGNDIKRLTMKAVIETANRLHIVIEDTDELVYQVPESVVPMDKGEDGVADSNLKLDFELNPFTFSVSRSDTEEVIFDSSASGFIFEDQYVRLRTKLPEDPFLYGLAEHSDSFRLPATDYVRTLWNRDAYGTGDNQNLYGAHPVYYEHRSTGTHGVFLRNSNGMDIIINQTESGDQYLEYNVLGGVMDLYFVAGPDPASVSRQYTEAVGLPAMFPYWAFGFNQCRYGYQDAYDVAEMVYNYSKAEIPLEIAWMDIDYMDRRKVFTNDPDRFSIDMVRELVDYLHRNNQKMTMMVDPAVGYLNNSAFERGLEEDIFLRRSNGSLYTGVVWPGVTVFPDWFHPSTQGWWDDEFARFFDPDTGIDIDQCWIDMNEPANFGCQFGCDPEAVVAEGGWPPEPPAVRTPPRELPGFSCAFQPDGTTDCEEIETLESVEDRRRSNSVIPLSRRSTIPHPSTPSRRSTSEKHMGLPARDLLYPKYAIHNAAAFETSYNAAEGGLSNMTVATDTIHANGLSEYDTHNLYGAMMSVATREAMEKRRPGLRPSIITRSTFSGSGAKVGKWTGDNYSSWWHYALHIRSVLNFVIAGVPFTGPDVCGFGGDTTEQLCARWSMLGAFSPFYRNHNGLDSISQEFYLWDTVAEAARKAIDIRYRLLDYIYTSLYRQTQDGTPMLSPMFYFYPEDKNTWDVESAFFYGDGLLVAPVLEENATHVEVYLPEDVFYDWYTHERIEGEGKAINVTDQSWTDIPLFIRGGVVMPLRTKSAMTTTELREQDFELLVALDKYGKAEGALYLDDGESLEPEGTTEVVFSFQGGKLSSNGTYEYETSAKIVKVTVLGLDVGLSDVQGIAVEDDAGSEVVLEMDKSIDKDFTIMIGGRAGVGEM